MSISSYSSKTHFKKYFISESSLEGWSKIYQFFSLRDINYIHNIWWEPCQSSCYILISVWKRNWKMNVWRFGPWLNWTEKPGIFTYQKRTFFFNPYIFTFESSTSKFIGGGVNEIRIYTHTLFQAVYRSYRCSGHAVTLKGRYTGISLA